MKPKPELLSPAGGMDALRAAVSAGADAVYLGAAAFGARAGAGFSDDDLRQAIRFAHLYGRRVYVTVNTLLKQSEWPQMKPLIAKLADWRADAVIVQDLGLLSLIKTEFPGLCVHASTQMSVHNASGAALLMELGVSRVVLARECSPDDVRAVAATGIETEVFVHGAQCVSVSGQCQFSAHIGGRSGNRGRCAQPCRLPYSYRGREGALLSMRDLNLLFALPRLLEAGASSFKIEGRLKRPEYVTVVTRAYRQALDAAMDGLPFDGAGSQDAMERVFSRGFTQGHAGGRQDADLINPDRVSHQGRRIGAVKSLQRRTGFFLAEALLTQTLRQGDGLQLRGSAEQDFIYSGPDVAAGGTAILRLRAPAKPGDAVWRLQDEAQLRAAREDALLLPSIPVDALLSARPGEPARLTLKAGAAIAAAEGPAPAPAQRQPLDVESARNALSKTGGTPFTLDRLELDSPVPAFLSVAALNRLRRDGLTALETALADAHPVSPAAAPSFHFGDPPAPAPCPPRLYAILHMDADRQAVREAGAARLVLAPDDFRAGQPEKWLAQLAEDDLLLLPRQMDGETLSRLAPLLMESGASVMADNIGQLRLPLQGPLYTGEGVPAWNAGSLRLLAGLGVRGAVLSRELSREEIGALPKDVLELILPVYGRAQLMQLNHCPERLYRGLSAGRAGCRLCERGEGARGRALQDRFGCRYPLSPVFFDRGCLIPLCHHKPLHLSILAAPGMSWIMDLRLEAPEAAVAVTRHYAALMAGDPPGDPGVPEPGRYLEGVS